MSHFIQVIHSFLWQFDDNNEAVSFCVWACGIVTIRDSGAHERVSERVRFCVSHILCLRATAIKQIKFIIWLQFSRVLCGMPTIGEHTIFNSKQKQKQHRKQK